ncbi:hypothetical protein HMPREF1870_00042 [Bacteroidales bacterium KA00344]|nr:hypothetical protein HMPREF1870_00042 [Bacteroidales bacterium KA00344]
MLKQSAGAPRRLRAPGRKANLRGVFHVFFYTANFALLIGINEAQL